MKVPGDPALAAEASALEVRMGALREQLNAGGLDLARSADGWAKFTPDVFAPSHGSLAVSADGSIRSEGTLPVKAVHKFSGQTAGFTALRINILPDSDDPKKWPERGAWISELKVSWIDPAGVARPVTMKEVFVDRLGGPQVPGPHGDVGGFPKLEGPCWSVFVPETPVPAGRLEIAMAQNAATGGSQATPVRRFTVETSARPEWTTLVSDAERLASRKSLEEMAARYKDIPGVEVPVMVGREDRETRVFARGNRLMKAELVTPGVPELLEFGAPESGMTRLDMARWIASPANPLTARVMVNRLWGELFGSGIVRTSEDFGTSGTPPSHPELLDHLALRFQGPHGWSLKAMLREIVLSATYRQTHRASKALVEKDPSNTLLARGPRNRLSAEMVRDQALSAGGLLSPKMYGPPVFPPQPEGVWSTVYSGKKWQVSEGEDRYRRGIYTYCRRTSGFPGFLTFDAPSRDLCNPRRLMSNTPLQALVTLNDPAHIEAAQGFAKRMAAHSPDLPAQLAFGIRVATQQVASPAMLDELASLHADSLRIYQETPAESGKLAANPETAALVLVANTLLNLDSALTR